MSLKAIEMQVALPRTFDAGKLQENKDQRSQQMYQLAAETTGKEEQQKRTTVIKGDSKGVVSNKNQKHNKQGNHKQKQADHAMDEHLEGEEVVHPYKGSRIDYSG